MIAAPGRGTDLNGPADCQKPAPLSEPHSVPYPRRRTSGNGEPSRQALCSSRYIDVVLRDFLDERASHGDGWRRGTGADAVEPQEDTHGKPGGALVAVDQRAIASDGVQQCRRLLMLRGIQLGPNTFVRGRSIADTKSPMSRTLCSVSLTVRAMARISSIWM